MGFFSSFRELRRLRKALEKTEIKLEISEAKREAERASHYHLVLNMLDRWHTSEKKTHAVSIGVEESVPAVARKVDPFASWSPEEREFDIKCFREAGHPDPEKAAEEAYVRNYVSVELQ